MLNISISIVVYNSNIEVLEKVFQHLSVAFKIAWEKLPTTFLIYVVDNSGSDKYAKLPHQLLNKTFSNYHYVNSNN